MTRWINIKKDGLPKEEDYSQCLIIGYANNGLMGEIEMCGKNSIQFRNKELYTNNLELYYNNHKNDESISHWAKITKPKGE